MHYYSFYSVFVLKIPGDKDFVLKIPGDIFYQQKEVICRQHSTVIEVDCNLPGIKWIFLRLGLVSNFTSIFHWQLWFRFIV